MFNVFTVLPIFSFPRRQFWVENYGLKLKVKIKCNRTHHESLQRNKSGYKPKLSEQEIF
jgi:hypothetical protein